MHAACSSNSNDSGIAKSIVESPLFVVEDGDDIADEAHQPTEHFCKITSRRAAVADFAALRGNDPYFASHFAERCSIFANHPGFISGGDAKVDSRQEEL